MSDIHEDGDDNPYA